MFKHYLRLRSVFDLYDYLKANGYRSKQRIKTDGMKTGGSVLSRGTLYHLLSNPVYIRKIRHGGKLCQDRHKAIIDQETGNKTTAWVYLQKVTWQSPYMQPFRV
jgi:site-specific DNA recombinase